MKIILDKDSREEPRFLVVDEENLVGAIQINRDLEHGAYVETELDSTPLARMQTGDVIFATERAQDPRPDDLPDPVHDIPAEADDVNEMRIQIARLVERDLARKRKADNQRALIKDVSDTLAAMVPELLKYTGALGGQAVDQPLGGQERGQEHAHINATVSYFVHEGADTSLDRWIMGLAAEYGGTNTDTGVGPGTDATSREMTFAFPSASAMSGFVESVEREPNPTGVKLVVWPER